LFKESDETQTTQSGLVHGFHVAIEKPAIGPVGMTAVDFIILIDPENMKLSGCNA
jgi:hypothetical protein